MYRTAFIWVFVAVLAIIAADLVVRLLHRGNAPGKEPRAAMGFRGLCRLVVNVIGFVCLVAAAWTGFAAILNGEKGLSGNSLMTHVIAAPAFAVASLAIALFWSHRNQFTPRDWSPASAARAVVLRKVFFWIALALAVPTLVSILAAMFPIPTPDQQQYLFLIHRSCALPLAAAGFLFAYFAFVSWREL